MHHIFTFIKEFKIPTKKELGVASASFSQKKFLLLGLSCIVAFTAMVFLLAKINAYFLVEVPADGGSISEGIIGMPTLVNPVLALSDADKDITALVYSGLMRKMPDGSFIPDLAESYTVSPDGMTYAFVIRPNAVFHDGVGVTASDVVFTIEKIKDPLIKSPRKLGWDGVTVTKKDEHTVVFTLKQPYISFMDNTTLGILPLHIWKNVTGPEFVLSTLNIKAIGSGPYKITSVKKTTDGIPTQYSLDHFNKFTLGVPHISSLTIVSYANEKDLIGALRDHSIDQASGISPENAVLVQKAGYTLHTAVLPRIFGLFFNTTNNKILAESAVVHAFDTVLNKKDIVANVLHGYGTVVSSPVPETIMKRDTITTNPASVDEANRILDAASWVRGADGIRTKGASTTVIKTKKVGRKTIQQKVVVSNGPVMHLVFSLTTGDTPELRHTAELIKEQFAKVGARVDIKVYGTGELNQIIRARSYESLFFGQIVNHESDLFSFWHSSQKNDPGLNISLYSNKKVDTILENAQKTLNENTRKDSYRTFTTEFNKDLPALLVYSPQYIYATSLELNHVSLDTVTIPSDRFASLYTWYAETDHVWKIFTH